MTASHGSPTLSYHVQPEVRATLASLKGGCQEAKKHLQLPKSLCSIRWTDTLMRGKPSGLCVNVVVSPNRKKILLKYRKRGQEPTLLK